MAGSDLRPVDAGRLDYRRPDVPAPHARPEFPVCPTTAGVGAMSHAPTQGLSRIDAISKGASDSGVGTRRQLPDAVPTPIPSPGHPSSLRPTVITSHLL